MTASKCRCGKPAQGGFVCQGCLDDFAETLTNMVWLFDELAAAISRQTRFSNQAEKVSTKGAPTGVTFDAAASKARRDLSDALGYWQGRVADALGLPIRFTTPLGDAAWLMAVTAPHKPMAHDADPRWAASVDRATWFLRGNLRTFPQAGLLIGEITRASNDAMEAIDRPAERNYLGPCGALLDDGTPMNEPASGLMCKAILWGDDREQIVSCKTCGAGWDQDLRRRLIKDEAERGMEDRIMTAQQAAQTLIDARIVLETDATKLQDRIRKWANQPDDPAKRPLLVKKTNLRIQGQLRPGYRLGDIIAIINRIDAKRATIAKKKAKR